MATSLLVRHGAMRFPGTFESEGVSCRRGEKVIVKTDRGLEAGDVLCPVEPRAVALLSDPTSGRIIRRMTDDDRAAQQRIKESEARELEECGNLVAQRRLQMQLIDAE